MENKSTLQGSDLTERRSHRRLSSILKVPRSPLRDLGVGNELHQESTIEKRRKSCRRVSFAETIRVFTPELQPAGANVTSGGDGAAISFSNENESTDSKCHITGMDRLLHAPLQAQARQSEWDYTNCNKDQTIFTSNNDMDMTSNYTGAIDDRLDEEKSSKIDSSLFSGTSNAPVTSSNFDFKISTGEKLWDFKPSASQGKIKFADFLARLGNENTTKMEDVEKENIFTSKEKFSFAEAGVPFVDALENTGNVTRVFKDQEDALELTKCHTANITTFLPTVNAQQTSLALGKPLTSHSSTNEQEFGPWGSSNGKPIQPISFDQTVICDRMPSHATQMRSVLKDIGPTDETKMYFTSTNEKTIIFTDENEMDLTKNDSVFFNSAKKPRQSIQINRTIFYDDQATDCPENDMDMTKSHTVAIDGSAISKMLTKDSSVESAKREEDLGLLPSNSECLENRQRGLATTHLPLRDVGENKLVFCTADIVSKRGNEKEHELFGFSVSKSNATLPPSKKTILLASEDEEKLSNTGFFLTSLMRPISDSGENLWDFKPSATKIKFDACFGNENSTSRKQKDVENNIFSFVSKENPTSTKATLPFFDAPENTGNITRVFRDQDEGLELTKSHTANITTFLPIEPTCDHDKENEPVKLKQSRVKSELPTSEKTILFSCEQDDMEMTRSHTIAINSGAIGGASKSCIPKSVFNDKKSQLMKLTRLSSGFNKTLFFSGNSEDMDLTQSHTVRIDQKPLIKDLTNETQMGADLTRHLEKNMEMTIVGHGDLETSALAGADCTTADNKTMVFINEQQDMDFTQAHTVAIDTLGPDSNQNPLHQQDCLSVERKKSKMAMQNRTVLFSDNGEMELTQSHTTCIDRNYLSSPKEKCISSSVDRTRYVCDDMEMTAFETADLQKSPSLDETKNNKTVVFTFDQQDMDITRSHTVAIDGNVLSKGLAITKTAGNFSLGPRCLPDDNLTQHSKKDFGVKMESVKEEKLMPFRKSIGPSLSMLKGNQLALESVNKALAHASCPDKTVVFEDDMEYTKSHTAVIDGIDKDLVPFKSKVFSTENMDTTKSKSLFIDNVLTNKQAKDDQKCKNSSSGSCNQIVDNWNTTTNRTKDVEKAITTSVLSADHRVRQRALPVETSLVDVPSKLHFVDDIPYKQAELSISRPNSGLFVPPFVFDISNKGNISSHRKSFSIFDETAHEVSDKAGNANIDLVTTDDENLSSRSLLDQKNFSQGEVKMQCPTTATEGQVLGNAPSKCLNNEDIFPETHARPFNQHVVPCDQETMEITKAHTAFLEVNPLGNYEHVDPIIPKSGCIPDVNSVELLNILPGSCTTGKRGYNDDDFSRSLPNKLFSESLGEMELTRMDTMTICDLSEVGKKTPFASMKKTCSLLGTEMDITQNDTECIDQELKEHQPATARIDVKSSSNLPLNSESRVSDKNDAIKDAAMALDAKYITLHANEMADANVRSGSMAILPPIAKTACDQEPINSPVSDMGVPSEQGENFAYMAQKTGADSISSQQSETCVTPELPEVVQKKHRLSKRVSFCFPEKVRESVADPNIELTVRKLEETSAVPNEFDSGQLKCGNMKDQVREASVKLNKVPIGGVLEDAQPLNNVTEKSEEMDNVPEDVRSTRRSLKENRRRSIADIQLKIKNLSDKLNNKPNDPTAPVSSPTKDFYVLPQTQDPVSEDCIPTQTLVNEQVFIEDTQANEKIPKGKETGVAKEISLQNRLSVNMLQPKLPSKRQANTCNPQELAPVSVSKPPTHTSRKSIGLLKAFADGDDGQCIDKEMLPACLDDHEGNSMLLYEVPDGAWEELCEKEYLQKNLKGCSSSKESVTGFKRARDSEDDEFQNREKRARRNDTHNLQGSRVLDPDVCSGSEYSSHITNKDMEQTCCSSSSQDSRGEGMSELSSQQYSQMDSQLPWDNACGQNLWQKFQDGSITVKEFFMLLRIHVLIQKPRYSELPANRGNYETLSATDMMLDRFVYQPKLQVYEEACQILYRTTEELKLYTNIQEKPLKEFSSLFWEAMKMCSEDELLCFSGTLKNMKSMYSKKSKILAHEAKVSLYSKLLQKAEDQVVEVRTKIDETSKLLEEMDDCIASLEFETNKLDDASNNNWANLPSVKVMECELENLSSQEQTAVGETSDLEERKEKALAQLGCLQEQSRHFGSQLENTDISEWEMVTWMDTKATFLFLYDALELTIVFGDAVAGETFNKQPCRRISGVTFESHLDEESAPASSLLVHGLILRFIEKKGCLHKAYRTQNDVPKLLFELSLVVSRCKLLGEEIDYLMKWGGKYNILKTRVESDEVKLLFSSSAAFAKFELSVQLSETYPTVPLSFNFRNFIGDMEYSRVAAVVSKVPVGLWLLKRAVRSIHENLLVKMEHPHHKDNAGSCKISEKPE